VALYHTVCFNKIIGRWIRSRHSNYMYGQFVIDQFNSVMNIFIAWSTLGLHTALFVFRTARDHVQEALLAHLLDLFLALG
jgi:hypothetical protein